MWTEASDDLSALERDIERSSTELTVDQRLQLVSIKATLALGQGLSELNPENYSGGGRRVAGRERRAE